MRFRKNTCRPLLFPILLFSIFVGPLLTMDPERKVNDQQFLRIEKKLISFINRERKKIGLIPIYFFKPLNQIARQQSIIMASSGQLSHFLPGSGSLGKRLRDARLFFVRCGENLVLSDIPVASVIHDEIMHSPSHRSNILNPYFTHCGIYISFKGDKYYVTQTFTQLFDPSTDGEAEFHLKEDLELWFVKNFNTRFVFHTQSKNWVRHLSKQNLKGNQISKPVKKWGSVLSFSMVYPDLEFIKEKLKEEITKISLDAISIGVASGRTRNYPNGTYAVNALLFGDYYSRFSTAELSRILLKKLNQLRVKNNQPVLKINQNYSKQAIRILKSSRRKKTGLRMTKSQVIYAFSMTNPQRIPVEVREQLDSKTKFSSEIGIGIYKSKPPTSLSQPFFVCIILKK